MSLSKIAVSLADEGKWQQFHSVGTEMIVTKNRGRVIFPHLDYVIRGLESDSLYTIHIHLERVDNIKYKFDRGEWKEAAKGDPILPIQYVEHSHGARTGEHWMREMVSFSTLKIINDPKKVNPKLILVQSMHKYQPVLTITRIGDMKREEFRLKLTGFTVVTAYQNEEMINLKVANNKFASGFRSNGKKRKGEECEDQNPKRRSPSDCPSTSSPSSTSPPSFQSLGVPTFYHNPSAFPVMNPFAHFSSTNDDQFNNFAFNQYNPWYYPNQHNFMDMSMWNMNTSLMVAQPTDNQSMTPFMNQ